LRTHDELCEWRVGDHLLQAATDMIDRSQKGTAFQALRIRPEKGAVRILAGPAPSHACSSLAAMYTTRLATTPYCRSRGPGATTHVSPAPAQSFPYRL